MFGMIGSGRLVAPPPPPGWPFCTEKNVALAPSGDLDGPLIPLPGRPVPPLLFCAYRAMLGE